MRYNLEDGYALKSLVENLFGKRSWLEIKHATSSKVWKKYSVRILASISLAARTTVEIADADWHKELESIIELGKSRIGKAKDSEAIVSVLAGTLGLISFHQLGRMPNNGHRSQVTLRHPGNWVFSQFRSVQYVQSREQAGAKLAHDKSRKQRRT